LVFAVIAVAVLTRKLDTSMRAGMTWSALFVIDGFVLIILGVGIPTSILAKTYCTIQILAALLLLASTIDVLLSHGTAAKLWHVRLARLAFLYIPMLFVACAGPLLLAGCSVLLPSNTVAAQLVVDWESAFRQGFDTKWYSGDIFVYNFAIAEILMTITVSAIPLFALVGTLLYFCFPTGKFARSWLFSLLIFAPICLALNLVAILAMQTQLVSIPTVDWRVIQTYRVSALRVIPFLPFLVGPLTILLGIAGDVVFYVLPNSSPLSSRGVTTSRLKELLARVDPACRSYCVFSHSQGSVIAVDALSERNDSRAVLVTLGSPIEALYRQFLDIMPGSQIPGTCNCRWINLFRHGDYIGGTIPRATVNRDIGTGGHVNYWDDPLFKQAINTMEISSLASVTKPLSKNV